MWTFIRFPMTLPRCMQQLLLLKDSIPLNGTSKKEEVVWYCFSSCSWNSQISMYLPTSHSTSFPVTSPGKICLVNGNLSLLCPPETSYLPRNPIICSLDIIHKNEPPSVLKIRLRKYSDVWEYSSVVKSLFSIHEVLGSIPSVPRINKYTNSQNITFSYTFCVCPMPL